MICLYVLQVCVNVEETGDIVETLLTCYMGTLGFLNLALEFTQHTKAL